MVQPRLQIRLLGELSVLRDGNRLPLPQSRKTRALLVYLILNPGPQRRERLCEIFWQLPDDPRGALRWSLSKLRGLVNDQDTARIEATREQVAFVPREVRIDVLEIRERLERGISELPDDELGALAGDLAGEYLPGLDLSGQPEFHYFLAAERQRLASLRGQVLRELAERSAGTPAGDLVWLQQLVEVEPYEAAHHVRLVKALAVGGRRKDAERQKSLSLEVLGDTGEADAVALQRAVHTRPAAAPVAPVTLQQEIRFCRASDGVQIAYACVGAGAPLVKVANWLNHLEFDWESPVWRHVFRELAQGRQLVRYDARGNGLSDWDTSVYDLESLVSDLEAVVDAVGIERFPLLALSQGCAVSVEYAARHPERVSKLILIGGYACGWRTRADPEVIRQTEAMLVLVRMGWGQDNPAFRQMFTSLFMPDAPAENQTWFNELQRITTSPENAAGLLSAVGNVDVRDRLREIRAPTLVLHARGDLRVPFRAGRELAGAIPGARFVSLDTANHLLPECDPAWPRLMSEINAFLAE